MRKKKIFNDVQINIQVIRTEKVRVLWGNAQLMQTMKSHNSEELLRD